MTHKRNITKNIRTTRNKRTTVSWVRDSPRLFVEDPERERIRKKTTVRERKRKMTTKKRTPSSRDEGLRLLHGLETNLAASLQTPQEA